ncbi:MAG: 2-hydroxyethylphosphonate methyltransferase [Alphaproteobacteria bacterium MarineAlpha3_Bin5]|nr:MAG: 2-hydroxyethylphosphonate methyltransferase [Alphaproteobacteria bacterium MarineAlpha3_Bin5]
MMVKKILDLLLINPGGRKKIYQELGETLTAVEPPLWCRLLAGYARDRGLTVTILDSEAENLDIVEIAEKVASIEPCLAVMVVFGHQPSASTQMMVGAGEACKAIKNKVPEQSLLMVGGHVSALPQRTLTEEYVDFVCKGEGPETIVQLIGALKKKEVTLDSVQGLVWQDSSGEIILNPPAPLTTNLDADLHGNVWDLLPMDKYRAHNWQCFGNLKSREPYASVFTSLGCPYKCSFCCINAPFDTNRYRMRSPESVVEEIEYLNSEYGIKTFKFIDEMFVLNERHVTNICNGLIEKNIPDLNIWAYARVDTVKPHMLEILQRAGFRWLALGIESGSKHVRDGADKAFEQDDIVNIVRQIQSAGIFVAANYIFGLPDDDEISMRETLDLAKKLNCEYANFYSAMAYPGSPLYVMALEKGWELPDSWSGYSQHSYDCKPLSTEKVSAAQVLSFRDGAFHEYFGSPRYLDRITQRFGWETRTHIEEMGKTRLKRKILENSFAAE